MQDIEEEVWKMTKTIELLTPRVTPIGMDSKHNYIYKVKGIKGCFRLVGYNKENFKFKFKKAGKC